MGSHNRTQKVVVGITSVITEPTVKIVVCHEIGHFWHGKSTSSARIVGAAAGIDVGGGAVASMTSGRRWCLGREFLSLILEKVKGDNAIAQNITRSGKKDLYSELLWYLTFGLLRDNCCYDSSIFATHGVSILEDLVIALADGIASVYLEFISVDSKVSSKTNSWDMSFCAMSTRELQKLRNEVALNQWLHHNMDTVVSMYEDHFDLCTLEKQPINLPDSSQTEKQSWWRNLTQQSSKTMSHELHSIVISHFSMPVKRTKELRALIGWRYYFSLLLELSDIMMPIVRKVINKASEAISFFLVSLIGRSVGLIYTGIRQSLKWK
ncbi:unnamed protein product [Vicia faba]|uniref:Peptidase M1 membrane alanine aminopeptidase domain-containing protein n=1 Tax=Vicia faba TaxID=3906 RepID=A0AAV1API7_VICFA|nr:unnamed protein product [Vicia faba]